VRKADVIAMHQAIKNAGYAAATANRLLVLTRFMFNCAIRWEILPTGSNPTAGVEAFPDNGARERYLSSAEVRRLFAELDRTRQRQVADIVRLLLYTGARKAEILNATWANVDLERGLLTVPVSKSGKPRHVALSEAAIEVLTRQPRRDGLPWVFVNPKTRKPPVSIFTAWDTIRKKAGLPDVRLHDLRHSFASFLVNEGRSLYEVQRLLGHADAKMTMRYAHLSPKAMVEAANVVGRTLENATA
jgi:integrase